MKVSSVFRLPSWILTKVGDLECSINLLLSVDMNYLEYVSKKKYDPKYGRSKKIIKFIVKSITIKTLIMCEKCTRSLPKSDWILVY